MIKSDNIHILSKVTRGKRFLSNSFEKVTNENVCLNKCSFKMNFIQTIKENYQIYAVKRQQHSKKLSKLECIPVGCVPSAAVTICWGGVSAYGGCLPRGMGGDVFLGGCLPRVGCLPVGVCLGGVCLLGGVCPGNGPLGCVCPEGRCLADTLRTELQTLVKTTLRTVRSILTSQTCACDHDVLIRYQSNSVQEQCMTPPENVFHCWEVQYRREVPGEPFSLTEMRTALYANVIITILSLYTKSTETLPKRSAFIWC